MTAELEQFIETVFNDIEENITDVFFKVVEDKPVLRKEYESLCSRHGQNAVNQKIGLLIKQMLDLDNTGRDTAFYSKLIKSYTKH